MLDSVIYKKYTDANGIEICGDYSADVGFYAGEGNTLQISVGGSSYQDFTVDEESFSGVELNYNEGLSGWTSKCLTSQTNTGEQIGVETTIPAAYANDDIRVALYLIQGGSEEQHNTFIHFGIMTYNVTSHQYGSQTPFYLYDMSEGNQKNFYLIGLPGSNPPGNVSWLWSRFDEMVTRCNTIRDVAPATFLRTYYNITQIATNVPIFDNYQHAHDYLEDPIHTTGLLNGGEAPDPEEEYSEQFDFWYIKNKWGHNTRNVDSNVNQKQNYRFYPKRKGICFIKHTPTAAEPYDRILYNYSNYDAKYAAWGEDADEDFIVHPGDITTHFLTKSISFGSNDYYTKFDYDTNIPLWKDQQDADDYYNGLKDISEAENYAYIIRQDNAILNPDLPGTDIDEVTAMRTNGMRFSYGVRLYEITNIELSNLMQEMFNPANVQDVIDGNKLFGANTMSAVSGVMYLPFADLSEICELGSLDNIKIGSWEAQTAQGKRIIKNEGTIDCGSFFYNRTYLDYRDYEPYNLLFVNLPFCGCHQLTISKYLDKTVNVSYNVDVCTGGIVAKITADGILVDIFEGTCGASRPISATDNNAYINSIVGAITGASSSASGSIEGITNAVGNVGKAANMGAAAAGGAAFGAVAVAAAAGASGVYTAYQVKNAVDNPPQMHRGSLAGNLGYYLNSKPSFLFFTKKSIRPENELETIGYPSGHGGAVGSFSGFLSCSAFKLADGFTGTDEERAEIMEIMRGGIYL